MIKVWAMFILALSLTACATTDRALSEKHQAKIQELDAQYKAGKIDAVQYQTKYAAEVENYNLERVTTVNVTGRRRYR